MPSHSYRYMYIFINYKNKKILMAKVQRKKTTTSITTMTAGFCGSFKVPEGGN